MDVDVRRRYEPSTTNSAPRKIPDEEYSGCQRGLNKIQTSVIDIYKVNRTWLWRGVLLFVALLYFAYFAYAMYYRFGDEGSIRLLAVTLFAVLIIVFRIVWRHIRSPILQCHDAIFNTGSVRRRAVIRWLLYIVALVIITVVLIVEVGLPTPQNLTSLAGLAALIVCCFVCSTNPGKVDWHPVFWGLALQFIFAALILRTQWGYDTFKWLGDRITEFMAHTNAGSSFVFGNYRAHFFAFGLMPVVTFFSAVISVLYHLGIMQVIVHVMGRFLAFCLGTTPAESINAAANIFVGMNVAPLMIAPFVESMTLSELHAVLTAGFATVAGAAFGAYIGFGVPPNQLIAACVMSAPAALAISKLLCPETEVTRASSDDYYKITKSKARNVIEAASEGAAMSISIIANILVNLIAFLSLLAFVNATLVWLGERVGLENFTFEFICSYVLYPIALCMGTALIDCRRVAELIGVKTFTNEIIAYRSLQGLRKNRQIFLNYTETYNSTDWYWNGQDAVLSGWNMTLKRGFLEKRSEVISTYALCGFSNVGAIAVLLATLATMAPSRKPDLSRIIVRAMIAGNLACIFTACIAGLFFKDFEN